MDTTADLVATLGLEQAGQVIATGDADYDAARSVWNGCIDRAPLAIVRPRDSRDIAAVIRATVAAGVPLAIRGGGHGLPGFATCDAGVVIDLARLCDVTVDPAARTARVGGGATWATFDAATAKHGLASTGGLISSTGVGGLTLGGGIGWLTRAHGLACDNLLSAELVTASAQVIRVSAQEHPDLFWALKGGGGNFGVVTAFEFRLHPVDTVQGGMLLFPLHRLGEVASTYRTWVQQLPDELTTILSAFTAPDTPDMPDDIRGKPVIGLVGCHLGAAADAERDLAPIVALGPAAVDFGPMPYPVLQSMIDADWPAGDRYYFTGAFSNDLPDALIELLHAQLKGAPGPRCGVDIHHMGGAAGRVSETDSAYAGRSASYTFNIIAGWDDLGNDETFMTWARQTRDALAPFCSTQGYVNFATDTAEPQAVATTYGRERFARLREIKRAWDPDNVFALNQNIQP